MSAADPIVLALQIAAGEAASARYPEVTPAHLLIGLSRLSEGDMGAEDAAAAVRREFQLLGVEARAFRRRLRTLLGSGPATQAGGPVEPSADCREVLNAAAALAAQAGRPMSAEHLFVAALMSLARGGRGSGGSRTSTDPIPDEL
ncbi:MAG: hypothetical protein HY271_10075 [Deltaproteobacteria bacterium]|nr:hypothetical protein [Deltaproteobacteria bacterium]